MLQVHFQRFLKAGEPFGVVFGRSVHLTQLCFVALFSQNAYTPVLATPVVCRAKFYSALATGYQYETWAHAFVLSL